MQGGKGVGQGQPGRHWWLGTELVGGSRNWQVWWQGPRQCHPHTCATLTPVPPWPWELGMQLWCLCGILGCQERAAVLVFGHPCSLGKARLWTTTLHPSFHQER